MNEEISQRIWIARAVMIIGIVILHTPPYKPLAEIGETPFELIKAFFSHGVFRASVPILTAISGFLMFSANLDQRPGKLFVKKFTSVFMPLIMWNLPLVLALYVIQKNEWITYGFSIRLVPENWVNWLDAVTGLFVSPLNYPTNFLRDLFAVSLLAPIMGLFLRRAPYIGLVLISVVYWFNAEGYFVLRNSMLVIFYIGGLAATQKWDLKALDRFSPYLLIVFLLSAAAIITFRIGNREWFGFISPFLLWPASSLIVNTSLGKKLHAYSKYSFFLFLVHAPLLLVVWLIYENLFTAIPYPVFWLMAPIVVVALAVCCRRLFDLLPPNMIKLALGQR